MSTYRIFLYSVVLISVTALSACLHRPPTQEMSDARQAVKQAKDAGAGFMVPKVMASAENQLNMAERKLAKKDYREARKAANAAKEQAVIASKVAKSFKHAKMAVKNAKAVNYLWRDTGKILKKAEGAANKGNSDKAVKMAKKAQTQAENALNQYYLEVATYIVRAVEAEGGKNSGLAAAKKALLSKNGKKAYDIAKKL